MCLEAGKPDSFFFSIARNSINVKIRMRETQPEGQGEVEVSVGDSEIDGEPYLLGPPI